MRIVERSADLHAFAGSVLVPTMGALHEGHFELVRRARRLAGSREGGKGGAVVVTVFVNPTQFNDPKDLARYPRSLEADAAGCREAGADVVFAPGVAEVYPPGVEVGVPALPEVATRPGLEDSFRPGHFAGVCQVVRRLFELVRPASAIFGEKDWQQLRVIAAMTEEHRLGVEIVPVPTVREPDGMAMSSRNRFLSAGDRVKARAVSAALREAGKEARVDAAEEVMHRTLEREGLEVEYATVRDAGSLMPLEPVTRGAETRGRLARALVACRIGGIRLIDNAPWPWASA